MTACGSRPCPVCGACGTTIEGAICPACLGTAPYHPYPWVEPDDVHPLTRAVWTREESAIVTSAPTLHLAVVGYQAVYGPCRSERSIREHRDRIRRDPSGTPRWSEAALDALDECESKGAAILTIAERFPGLPVSASAVYFMWRRTVLPRLQAVAPG